MVVKETGDDESTFDLTTAGLLLGFTQEESDAPTGLIKVNSSDIVTVTYHDPAPCADLVAQITIELVAAEPQPAAENDTAYCLDDPEPPNQTTERRQILSWLAYSVAYLDWQTSTADRRGYNIGAVLVDKYDLPVYWGRNCVTSSDDGTRHAEVTTIEGYIQATPDLANISTHRLYTSLQTCAQCAGMATLQQASQVIYGETDVNNGQALQVFKDNTTWNIPSEYPAPTVYFDEISDSFAASGAQSISVWLYSDTANVIMKCAYYKLKNYPSAVFSNNDKILVEAQAMLAVLEEQPADRCKPQ